VAALAGPNDEGQPVLTVRIGRNPSPRSTVCCNGVCHREAGRAGWTATNAAATSNLANRPPTSGTIAVSADIRSACGISDEEAYFTFDSASLESKDISPLNALAKCFPVGPLKGRSMRLVGHADPRGSSEYNLVLGQRRADSVGGYLDHHGLTRSQVETTSRGSMDATGSDDAGWTRDRRVDVMLGSG
jgi:peptidoglycan-associated lipoprotein